MVAPLAFFDMVAVVFASSIGLKCVLFNFIAMCPSDKRPRVYALVAAKKNERRSEDWTMRWPARVKATAFFVTTAAGECGGTSNDGTSTRWTGSS